MWFPGYTGMGIVSWKALTLQKWQKLDSISILLAVPFMQQCDIYWRFIFQESCCWCLLWPIEGQLPIRESNSKDQTVLPNITANFPSRCPLLGLSKSKTIYHDKVCIHTLIRENVESQNTCMIQLRDFLWRYAIDEVHLITTSIVDTATHPSICLIQMLFYTSAH